MNLKSSLWKSREFFPEAYSAEEKSLLNPSQKFFWLKWTNQNAQSAAPEECTQKSAKFFAATADLCSRNSRLWEARKSSGNFYIYLGRGIRFCFENWFRFSRDIYVLQNAELF